MIQPLAIKTTAHYHYASLHLHQTKSMWHTQVSTNVAGMWHSTGVMLGPILFILYSDDLVSLVERHGFRRHPYTDDTQVYSSRKPSAVADIQAHLSACVDDVATWMLANHLQLNTGKTDLLWCATAHHCHQLPTSALRIGSDFVNKLKSV